MANEIYYSARLKCKNGNLFVDRNVSGNLNQSLSTMSYNVEHIGTTVTQVVITSSVTLPGQCFLRNLDTTNSVDVGFEVANEYDAGYPLFIPAGGVMLLGLNTNFFYARANVAPVLLEVLVLNQ